MKKALILIACLSGGLSAFAQGYVNFANIGTGVAAPFHDNNGTALTGGGYMVQLLAGTAAGSATDALTPIFSGNFASGFFNAGSITVPAGDISGGSAFFVVRAWSTMGGTVLSYAAAQSTVGALWGTTTAFQVTPQSSATLPPAALAGMPQLNGNGNMIQTVPEPTVLALGVLGVGALLLRRRK